MRGATQIWLILVAFSYLITALVTLDTMRNLTAITDECRKRITGGADGKAGMSMPGQVVLDAGISAGENGDDSDEIEDAVAAALRMLCSDLLVELEKPLDSSSKSFPTEDSLFCRIAIREFHHFLEATTKFLHEIQERQMLWHWSAESGVFDGMSWLQGLWASRKTNSRNRSFIEQQMAFYGATGCFGKDQEVLRRDVEIVEYMNDLIDSFQ